MEVIWDRICDKIETVKVAIPNHFRHIIGEGVIPMTFANKLTALAVQNAKPNSSKIRRLYDGEGLHLEISKNGRKGWRI